MLTGHRPYAARTPEEYRRELATQPVTPVIERNPDADPGLARICEGAMARQAIDRYHTMFDVVADLERVRDREVPLGPDQGRTLRTLERWVLVPKRVAAAAAVFFLLAGLLTVRLLFPPKPNFDLVRRTVFEQPAPRGKILFNGRRKDGDSFALWCVDPDGGHLQQLTERMQALGEGAWLVTDGKARGLACDGDFRGSHELGIFLQDGTLREPTEMGNGVHNVRASPDGKRVAYLQRFGRRTLVRLADSDTGTNRLLRAMSPLESPQLAGWLPDGTGLLLVRWPGIDDDEPFVIDCLRFGTTNAIPILSAASLNHHSLGNVTCSRHGARIAFWAIPGRHSSQGEIWVGELDASNNVRVASLRPLTRNRYFEHTPVFSPDGEEVAFTRQLGPEGVGPPGRLVIRRWDGTGDERELVRHFVSAFPCDWAAWTGTSAPSKSETLSLRRREERALGPEASLTASRPDRNVVARQASSNPRIPSPSPAK
jgi:hypothetical protein